MDALLQTLGVQTVNYAIRSGIALTSKYAVQQCSRLLKTVNDKAVHAELKALQKLLDSKIKVGRFRQFEVAPRPRTLTAAPIRFSLLHST